MFKFYNLTIFILGAAFAHQMLVVSEKSRPTLFFNIGEQLELVREKLKEHDPYFIEKIPLQFDVEELIGNMTMSNVTADSFSNFTIKEADLGVTHFNFTFFFPKIHVKYHYKGYALFYDFIPMYGDGDSDIHLVGLDFGLNASVGMNGVDDPIFIRNSVLDLGLKDCEVEISGLLENEALGNITAEVLTDFIKLMINEKMHWINKKFTPELEKIINDQLVAMNITPHLIIGN